MRTILAVIILAMLPHPALGQVDRSRGQPLQVSEVNASPEGRARCQAGALAILQSLPDRAADPAVPRDELQHVRSCEMSGIGPLIAAWRSPRYRELDVLRLLTEVTWELHDRRLLEFMRSIAEDPVEPELIRFAALGVLAEYVSPGRGMWPDRWYQAEFPDQLRISGGRNHVRWVVGQQPIREEDLRSLGPALEVIAARSGDPAREIAEWILQQLLAER